MLYVYKNEIEITAFLGHTFKIFPAVRLYQEIPVQRTKNHCFKRIDNSVIKGHGNRCIYSVALYETLCWTENQLSAFGC